MECMKLIPTGIKGFDELTGGGLPRGRCVLLVGGPGSGKTIFSMQFLVDGAVKKGEPGVFVTLDESAEHLREEMMGFGWDVVKLEKAGLMSIVDASPIRYVPPEVRIRLVQIGGKGFSIEGLIKLAGKEADRIGARRIAVDPLNALSIHFADPVGRRESVMKLYQELAKMGHTSLITSELKTGQLERELGIEEYTCHGVIILHTVIDKGSVIRAIQVEKMRGVSIDNNLHPYKISGKGIEVFPKEKIF